MHEMLLIGIFKDPCGDRGRQAPSALTGGSTALSENSGYVGRGRHCSHSGHHGHLYTAEGVQDRPAVKGLCSAQLRRRVGSPYQHLPHPVHPRGEGSREQSLWYRFRGWPRQNKGRMSGTQTLANTTCCGGLIEDVLPMWIGTEDVFHPDRCCRHSR